MRYLIVLFLINLFYPSKTYAQVEARFDPASGKFDLVDGYRWNPGELLQIYVLDYNPLTFKYKIEYTSSENFNKKGFALFNTLESIPKGTRATSYILYSQYVIDNKDLSHISITQIDNTGKEMDKRMFTYPVRGGLKFDVSTGAFGHGLRDDVFVLVSGPNGKSVIKENSGDFNVGTGILLHLHSRKSRSINAGISLGLEVDGDAKIGYLIGPSALIGYDQKFIFTIGLIARKIYKISNAYKEVAIVDNSIVEIPRVNVWTGGVFFAATYNF